MLVELQMHPYLLALALLAGTLLVGSALGMLYRTGGGPTRRLENVLAWPPVVLTFAALGIPLSTVLSLGVWDATLFGAWVGCGFLVGVIGPRRCARGLATVVIAFTVSFVVAELAFRQLVLAPPGIPPAESVPLLFPDIDVERNAGAAASVLDACANLSPDRYPERFAERIGSKKPSKPVVLHLGDSMTFGLFVSPSEAFPALLGKETPALHHVSGASPGTTVDYHLLIARRWMDRLPMRLLVLHLFDNDVMEMDQRFACCNNAPLLEFRADGPVDRCPSPVWPDGFGHSLGWRIRSSPMPYHLRIGARSWMARYLFVSLMARVSPIQYDRETPMEDRWRHFTSTLAALRDEAAQRGVPLVVVLLPFRAALDSRKFSSVEGRAIQQQGEGAWDRSRRMKSICEELGLRVLDSWEHFGQLIRAHGSEPYFIAPDDIHFSVQGHVEMAHWLRDQLHLSDAAG
jgi:hypothetical protein